MTDYYKSIGVTTSSYSGAIKKNGTNDDTWWWLRTAYSNDDSGFFSVSSIGSYADYNANGTGGVSPAFRIG